MAKPDRLQVRSTTSQNLPNDPAALKGLVTWLASEDEDIAAPAYGLHLSCDIPLCRLAMAAHRARLPSWDRAILPDGRHNSIKSSFPFIRVLYPSRSRSR